MHPAGFQGHNQGWSCYGSAPIRNTKFGIAPKAPTMNDQRSTEFSPLTSSPGRRVRSVLGDYTVPGLEVRGSVWPSDLQGDRAAQERSGCTIGQIWRRSNVPTCQRNLDSITKRSLTLRHSRKLCKPLIRSSNRKRQQTEGGYGIVRRLAGAAELRKIWCSVGSEAAGLIPGFLTGVVPLTLFQFR
jgi:hypothetical protein